MRGRRFGLRKKETVFGARESRREKRNCTGKEQELSARNQPQALSPLEEGAQSRAIAETRRALTSRVVEGKKAAKARLEAKGHQDPDLKGGIVDISGCVSKRSSH